MDGTSVAVLTESANGPCDVSPRPGTMEKPQGGMKSGTSQAQRIVGSALLALLGLLAAHTTAHARPACPPGMAASGPTCCAIDNEYVPAKNACLQYRPERHCAEGRLDACIAAARELEGKSPAGAGYAAELFRFACESGAPAGCRGLGLLYRDGRGIDADVSRARVLLEQACAQGDALSCVDAAELTLAVSADEAQAADLLAQACNRGAGSACLRVLRSERAVAPVSGDRERGLLEQACAGDDPEGCTLLGDALLEGLIAPQSSVAAAHHFRAACEAGQSEGCLRLAVLTEQGDGVIRDAGAAVALYARACGAGLAPACARQASITRAATKAALGH